MTARRIKPPANLSEALQRLGSMPARLLQTIARSIDRTNQETIGHIVTEKLSKRSKTTLGRVTSTLARSVNATPAAIKGGRITSSIGTNIEYARVHELGIDENVMVRAHKRTQSAYAFGKPNPKAGEPVAVRAHKRHMKMPARRWLSSGLEERESDYTANLEEDIGVMLRS